MVFIDGRPFKGLLLTEDPLKALKSASIAKDPLNGLYSEKRPFKGLVLREDH